MCIRDSLSPEQALITAASEPIASVLMSWAFFQMSFDMIQGMSSQSLDSLLLLPGKLYQGDVYKRQGYGFRA